LGDGVLAEPRGGAYAERGDGGVPRADRAAPTGEQQPPRGNPPARLSGDERDDRGRHLRQRQLDPHHGLAHPERDRRLGRLRAQRLRLDLHEPLDRQGRQDIRDRAAGPARRPHHAGRDGPGNRAGPRRLARTQPQATRRVDHRQLRAPRLPPAARRLLPPRPRRGLRAAVALAADRGALVAPALHRNRRHAAGLSGPSAIEKRQCFPAGRGPHGTAEGPMTRTAALARYHSASIVLHWLMFALIAAAYATIELREIYPRGSDPREALKAWHFMLGLSVLALVWLRIAARLAWPAPAPDANEPAWRRLAAHAVHAVLYLFM